MSPSPQNRELWCKHASRIPVAATQQVPRAVLRVSSSTPDKLRCVRHTLQVPTRSPFLSSIARARLSRPRVKNSFPNKLKCPGMHPPTLGDPSNTRGQTPQLPRFFPIHLTFGALENSPTPNPLVHTKATPKTTPQK